MLVAAVAVAFTPGVAMYDTVAQYGQVLGNEVDDWHPPVMVRLWQLLHHAAAGTAPMFALQVALYAFGFALIVAALGRSNRWLAALAAAALAFSPLLLGWQMVVLKDAQMEGALLAAFGIVGCYRLAERRVPVVATVLVAVLIVYATLVRANALFATIPLSLLLLPRPASLLGKAVVALAAILVLLGATPLVNHRLFGASPSGVAKSQPLFDLAAIAAATTSSPSPFTPAERREIEARHCVKAFFWDPLGDPTACQPATARLDAFPESVLYADLARAAAHHPLAYAAHRLAHWNSTERWLVQSRLIDAGPPDEAEPNDLGLTTPPSAIVRLWQAAAAVEAATPLGWPIVWTVVAVLLMPLAWRCRAEPAANLALALLASAITLEASFLVVSIASDLRYHLWPMTASALALILLSNQLRLNRRQWIMAGALLVLVVGGGIFTRASLPPAPDSYQATIHAALT